MVGRREVGRSLANEQGSKRTEVRRGGGEISRIKTCHVQGPKILNECKHEISLVIPTRTKNGERVFRGGRREVGRKGKGILKRINLHYVHVSSPQDGCKLQVRQTCTNKTRY